MLGPPKSGTATGVGYPPTDAAKSGSELALWFGFGLGARRLFGLDLGFWLILARVNAEKSVDLGLRHRPVARSRRHHEITHQLNL